RSRPPGPRLETARGVDSRRRRRNAIASPQLRREPQTISEDLRRQVAPRDDLREGQRSCRLGLRVDERTIRGQLPGPARRRRRAPYGTLAAQQRAGHRALLLRDSETAG